jgi:hypothetical protein
VEKRTDNIVTGNSITASCRTAIQLTLTSSNNIISKNTVWDKQNGDWSPSQSSKSTAHQQHAHGKRISNVYMGGIALQQCANINITFNSISSASAA